MATHLHFPVFVAFVKPFLQKFGVFQISHNVPEEKRTKGRKHRLRFSVGQAAVGGAAHTSLLCAVCAFYQSYYFGVISIFY
jgi:hypothetical protein